MPKSGAAPTARLTSSHLTTINNTVLGAIDWCENQSCAVWLEQWSRICEPTSEETKLPTTHVRSRAASITHLLAKKKPFSTRSDLWISQTQHTSLQTSNTTEASALIAIRDILGKAVQKLQIPSFYPHWKTVTVNFCLQADLKVRSSTSPPLIWPTPQYPDPIP